MGTGLPRSVFLSRCFAWWSRYRSRRNRRHRVRQNAAQNRHLTLRHIAGDTPGETFARRIAYLRKLDPLVFEELVLDGFQRHGWTIQRGIRYSGDGGIDGRIFKDGRWHGIQCKRYRSNILKTHVLQFAEDLHRYHLEHGFFVHTGKTSESIRKTLPRNVAILSGQALIAFLTK
ncbi:MAG: restriction endonuclease [Acidithiobacillus sp.]|nr:restriction endonuclease [Acidithiobacillus sp.]